MFMFVFIFGTIGYVCRISRKLNYTPPNDITYKHYKQLPINMLNEQSHYKTHKLFDIITQASHTNVSVTANTVNRKTNPITASVTAKH